jgi:hypothetical protein
VKKFRDVLNVSTDSSEDHSHSDKDDDQIDSTVLKPSSDSIGDSLFDPERNLTSSSN